MGRKRRELPTPDVVAKMNTKDTAALLRSMAKTANERLRELESKGYAEGSYAYDVVAAQFNDYLAGAEKLQSMYDVTASGELKFSGKTRGQDRRDMQHRIARIRKFLESKTSTVKGIRDTTSKAYESYTAKFGTKLSQSEYAAFWTSAVIANYIRIYGSDQTVSLSQRVHGMDIDEIEEALAQVGFTAGTDYPNEPDSADIDAWLSGDYIEGFGDQMIFTEFFEE